jgi:hypothetical protein
VIELGLAGVGGGPGSACGQRVWATCGQLHRRG